jgi:hypothetical protein
MYRWVILAAAALLGALAVQPLRADDRFRIGSTTAVLVARPAHPQYVKQLTTLVHRASWQRWAKCGLPWNALLIG